MFNNKFTNKLIWIPAMLLLAACSKNDSADPVNPPGSASHYAILTGDMTQPPYAGNVTIYNALPSGDFNNVTTGTLAFPANGLRAFGKWVFKRVSVVGQTGVDGVQRYSMDAATGQLKEDKAISSGGGSNFQIYSESQGFYLDVNRGLLKIQTFNPSTMERTGEIDLSAAANNSYAYQVAGSSIMVVKEGKLFVDILHGSVTGKGGFFVDPAPGYVEMAVIDIPTGKYEKTIRLDGISYLGFPGNENQMWTLGDDGALYLCSHGFSPTGPSGSAIVRINKGQTEFDKNWIIKADDYTPGTTFATVVVKDGKLYTQIGTQALSYTTIPTAAIYDYYSFNTSNPATAPVKISGMPSSTYAFQNAQCITVLDGKVYFRVVNDAQGKNGYYVLSGTNSATPVFNITSGGQVWGLVKLND